MQSVTTKLFKIIAVITFFISLEKGWSADFIVVPTAKKAGNLAEIVLPAIYGKEVLEQKPFIIIEKNGYWYIDGQLPKPPKGFVVVGGTVHCEIKKKDGAFSNITHGK